LTLRSEGGDHDPDGLILLCSAHHRAQHRGQLIIDGRVSTGLVFRHADGAPYGAAVSPRSAQAQVEAFRALRALGFRESEVRHALNRVRTTAHVGEATTETVLRQALAVLTAAKKPVAPDAHRVS
jgi:transposase